MHFPLLIGVWTVGLACGPRGSSSTTAAPRDEAEALQPAPFEPRSPHEASRLAGPNADDAPAAPLPTGDDPQESVKRRTPFPSLRLVSTELARPSPPTRADRWREAKVIDTGVSHLQLAELSGDGRRLLLLSGAEARARVHDAQTGRLLSDAAVAGIEQFGRGTLSWWRPRADGTVLLACSARGLALHDAGDGAAIATLDERPCWELFWSPDGRYLLTVASEIPAQRSTLTAYETVGEQRVEEIFRLEHETRIDSLDISDDNRLLALLTYPDDRITLADLPSGQIRWRTPAPRYGASVDLSPDGRWLAAGGERLVVMKVDDPDRAAWQGPFGNNIGRVRFTPAGERLFASSYDGRARGFAIQEDPLQLVRTTVLRHRGQANVYALEFTTDGRGLWTTSGDRTARLWRR